MLAVVCKGLYQTQRGDAVTTAVLQYKHNTAVMADGRFISPLARNLALEFVESKYSRKAYK